MLNHLKNIIVTHKTKNEKKFIQKLLLIQELHDFLYFFVGIIIYPYFAKVFLYSIS